MKTGFAYKDTFLPGSVILCRFMECKGKDISFPRWRFDLYYAPHLACTHFEYSEEDYQSFINAHKDQVYSDYSEYIAA